MTNEMDEMREKMHQAIEECLPQEYAMKGIIRHIVGKVLSGVHSWNNHTYTFEFLLLAGVADV